ncbi:MAG TPA: hypothetical protein VN939_22560 [Chthoniobacterales bacterium]|jgi:hypothetical protein|nr:hypothetical protein [Chthoniobacterales bacterium]
MTGDWEAEEVEAYEPSWSSEFPRKPDVQYAPDVAAQLDTLGRIDRPPRTNSKSKWRKPRSEKKKPKPLRDNVRHLTIYACHHRNQECWSKVAILSEIDCLMKTNDGPCYASVQHLAAVGKVVWGTAKNYVTEWENAGVIISRGYRGRTKNRIVAPKHSNFPALSKRIIKDSKNRKTGDVPF